METFQDIADDILNQLGQYEHRSEAAAEWVDRMRAAAAITEVRIKRSLGLAIFYRDGGDLQKANDFASALVDEAMKD